MTTNANETAYFERFTITLTSEDADYCSHPGSCDQEVAEVTESAYVRAQLDTITDEQLRDELREYGAWDEDELSDRDANERRIVWIAGGNIREERR